MGVTEFILRPPRQEAYFRIVPKKISQSKISLFPDLFVAGPNSCVELCPGGTWQEYANYPALLQTETACQELSKNFSFLSNKKIPMVQRTAGIEWEVSTAS